MGFNTSYIVNDSLVLGRKNGVSDFNQKAGSTLLPVSSEVILLEKNTPTTIDYMEWRTSHQLNVALTIEYLDSSGIWQDYTYIILTSSNAYTKEIQPQRLVEEASNQFVVLQYDTNLIHFKVASKTQFHFTNGVRIKAINKSSVNTNTIGYLIRGREEA